MSAPVTAVALPAAIEKLDQMDDDQFKAVVAAGLDSAADRKVWFALCHPAILDRTAGCLDEMAEDLEEEIVRRSLPASHHKSKQLNMVRARTQQVGAAEDRLGRKADKQSAHELKQLEIAQAKEEKRAAHERHQAERRREEYAILIRLAMGINAHRRSCIAADLAPEPHDVALWGLLDDLTLPADARESGPTLAEMIATGRWRDEATS